MRPQDDGRFFSAECVEDLIVVRFAPPATSLDESTALSLGEFLSRLIDGGGPGRLIVDLGNVAYLSSLALGVFVGLHRRMRARGGQLTLRNLRPPTYEVFDVTRLTQVLDVQRQEESA
jgi:anti-sigma B factor antagonist